jgi:hypothetical protein
MHPNVPGLGAGALCGWPCASGQSPGSLARVGCWCYFTCPIQSLFKSKILNPLALSDEIWYI